MGTGIQERDGGGWCFRLHEAVEIGHRMLQFGAVGLGVVVLVEQFGGQQVGIMVVVGGRDVARRVSTLGVKPGQQSHQRAVGPRPHQAVDGLQLGRYGGW